MKKIILLTVAIVLIAGTYIYYSPAITSEVLALTSAPCTIPLAYAIGTIDSRFGVTQDQVAKDAQSAAGIWNAAYGKNLYVYDPKAKLKINLVYDERQAEQVKLDQQLKDLESSKQSIQPTEEKYNSLVADFQTRLKALNTQITYWNTHGGAPPDIYTQLITEQNSLKSEVSEINTLAQQLNKSTVDYNSGVDSLNQTVQDLNSIIQNKPEEGIYDPNQDLIELYVDVDHNEFVHTLAHELGHASGLGHDANAKSIMYPYTSQSTTPTKQDLDSLKSLCTTPVTAQTIINRIHNEVLVLVDSLNK